MSNPYDKELIEIAGIIREASVDGNWENFEVGISVNEIPETFNKRNIQNDQQLFDCISVLELNSVCDLDQGDVDFLLSAFTYASHSVSELGIDVSQALWQKYFINFYSFILPLSATTMEINRSADPDVIYEEGLFDKFKKERHSQTAERLRQQAYRDAELWVKEASFPFREENVGIIQLVFRDWLVRLGKNFTCDEIHGLLMAEICELMESKKKIYLWKEDKWNRAYEACDVMIYVMHMFTVYGKNMGELLRH